VIRSLLLTLFGVAASAIAAAAAPATAPSPDDYHIYAGNTHAHTEFTWSHGEQWMAGDKGGEPPIDHTPDGARLPGKSKILKPEWQKLQGPPAEHFALANKSGYDFYVTTDHSQEAGFQPPNPNNKQWLATTRQAAEATDGRFVAIAGFEHSENNGPGGKGHINVINSAEYLNALAPGIDLPYLYKWLATAKPNGAGPVVASFNHPGAHQYDDWADRDPQVTDIITMLEVINSNNRIHYQAFVNALDKGWKVSPVCGNDNHGFWGITRHASRTFVLATERTKPAILDAMKHRRTYASLDHNIQCRYSVNGQIMGSTLDRPGVFHFDIPISDPDRSEPKDRITKIDIVSDGGKVVDAYLPSPPDFSVHWQPTIEDSSSKYFFVRVYNAGGGDAPKADPNQPVAWLAPVWTGR
jgi:hypothetical protein